MKQFFVFLLVSISSMSFAQVDDSWRDSLVVARKAYEKKDYAKALRYYESAQKKAPDNIDLSDEMAQSAYRMREFERAEKIYQQGSNSKKSKEERGDAMHNLGNAQMKQKNYEGAIDSYKEALRNNPTDDQTRYNLSEAIRKMKDEQENPPPPPPKQNQQNQSQQQNQQQNQGGNSQQNKSNNQGQKQQGQGKNQQGQGDKSQGNSQQQSSGQGGSKKEGQAKSSGKLSNQMVERTLDDIAKKEGETKRRMSGSSNGGKSSKSGKDW